MTDGTNERLRAAVYGHLVGDAIGVPYEFGHHIETVELRGHGTHNQPSGTWSDDGALMLALLDSLASAGFDPEDQGRRALAWADEGRYAPGKLVFDIGNTTSAALARLRNGVAAIDAGPAGDRDQGNGSLMRILPLALVDPPDDDAELVERAHLASRVTHAHPSCQVACALYVLVARTLLEHPGGDPEAALGQATDRLIAVYEREPAFASGAVCPWTRRSSSRSSSRARRPASTRRCLVARQSNARGLRWSAAQCVADARRHPERPNDADSERKGPHLIRRFKAVLAATLVVSFALAAPVGAAVPVNSSVLVEAVDALEINTYLNDLQVIANAHGGTRASGTTGYAASVAYIDGKLQAAGYETEIQEFTFPYVEVREATLQALAPAGDPYVYLVDFLEGFASPNGAVEGIVVPIDVVLPQPAATSSTSGCEASDFVGFPQDVSAIALIQRGTCDFTLKVANAIAAGADGVIIFNEGNAADRLGLIFPDVTGSTVPAVGTTFEVGQELVAAAQAEGGLTMRLALDFLTETRTTWNVLAELQGQRDDRVVLVGAHLDSVQEGPGINDNGSGSAMILDLAIEMADLEIVPVNTVRFAWWGAEESGLLGADYYVSQLSKSELKDIAVNLNFDMVASPNYVRFVYDGDAGPVGSGVVEDVFLDWFASQGLETEPTEFDGRSDYGPFILQGVPAGGLFTGAEGLKTEAQAITYGGTAGQQYDPCYHAACDTIGNVNTEVLEQMADAAAHATLTFAMTSSAVPGTAKGKAHGQLDDLEFTGSRANR